MKCSVTLPPQTPEAVRELIEKIGMPSSREREVKALVDSFYEAISSREHTAVIIVGEWGEGKTTAWYALVKPLASAKGFKSIEVRASTLHNYMRRLTNPETGFRLVAGLASVIEGNLVDSKQHVRRVFSKLGSEHVFVFIDEVEDLTYRDAISEFLEALHAILDGEADSLLAGVKLHFYLAASPLAYASFTSWQAWRRLRRRIRVVELKPLTRGEALETMLKILDAYGGVSNILEDPRLLNAIVEASKGNLGTLIAYARRLLAAWVAKSCKSLTTEDIERILLESLVAGADAAGLNKVEYEALVSRYGVQLRDALLKMVLEPYEAKGLPRELFVEACVEQGGGCYDNIFVTREGVVAVDGVFREMLSSVMIKRVVGCARKVYVLNPIIAKRVYTPSEYSIAPFVVDERVRRKAVREATRNPMLAAYGLALLLRKLGCGEKVTKVGDYVLVSLNVKGLRVKALIAYGEFSGHQHLLVDEPIHVVIVLKQGVSVETRLVKLEAPPVIEARLDALSLLMLSTLAFVSLEDPKLMNWEKVGEVLAPIVAKLDLPTAILDALEKSKPRLVVTRLKVPPGYTLDDVVTLVRLVSVNPGQTINELCRTAKELGLKKFQDIQRVKHLISVLAAQNVLKFKEDRVSPSLSENEMSILEVLKWLGGKAKVETLSSWLVPEGGWSRDTLIWLKLLAVKGYIKPLNPSARSVIQLIPLEDVKKRVERLSGVEHKVVEKVLDETSLRAYITNIQWFNRVVSKASRREKHSVHGVSTIGKHLARHEAKQVSGEQVKAFTSRSFEVVRLIEAARVLGHHEDIEEIGEAYAKIKAHARDGKVEDALVELSDLIATHKSWDRGLVLLVSRLEPHAYQVIELIEDEVGKLRAAEKMLTRSIRKLIEKSLRTSLAFFALHL